jgi:hypothetical protein
MAMLIEQYLPTFDVRDSHELRVAAPADAAYAALRALDLTRSWIVQALFALRSLPGRELVAGAATQPWKSVVTFHGLPPAEFTRFATPGFTKIVWAMAARPMTPAVSVLSIETRVLATDAASRRTFRLYWLVVSPGVRLLRWAALHRAKRALERARP